MRRLLRICVLAAPIFVLSAGPAAAAMWLRIDVAGPVVAGTPAVVTVTTVVLYSQGCIGDPNASSAPNGIWYSSDSAPSEPTFKLAAYPAGRPDRAMPIPLIHRDQLSPYWDGSVTFPSAGSWTVRMAEPNWGTAESEVERCAGARVDVLVASGSGEGSTQPIVGLVAFAVLALGVALAARRRA